MRRRRVQVSQSQPHQPVQQCHLSEPTTDHSRKITAAVAVVVAPSPLGEQGDPSSHPRPTSSTNSFTSIDHRAVEVKTTAAALFVVSLCFQTTPSTCKLNPSSRVLRFLTHSMLNIHRQNNLLRLGINCRNNNLGWLYIYGFIYQFHVCISVIVIAALKRLYCVCVFMVQNIPNLAIP